MEPFSISMNLFCSTLRHNAIWAPAVTQLLQWQGPSRWRGTSQGSATLYQLTAPRNIPRNPRHRPLPPRSLPGRPQRLPPPPPLPRRPGPSRDIQPHPTAPRSRPRPKRRHHLPRRRRRHQRRHPRIHKASNRVEPPPTLLLPIPPLTIKHQHALLPPPHPPPHSPRPPGDPPDIPELARPLPREPVPFQPGRRRLRPHPALRRRGTALGSDDGCVDQLVPQRQGGCRGVGRGGGRGSAGGGAGRG